ncbi:MAG: hypothetical protein GY862_39510 [Gammaproteobacteria bacterium]|nr:hypothetical protein [Gammaproteobacteria bacterium]
MMKDNQFHDLCFSYSPRSWQTRQVIIFDWHDGPCEGICELANPHCCFSFNILAERHIKDDINDRLFIINEISLKAVELVIHALTEIGPVKSPIWIPVWKFNSDELRLDAERKIEEILASKKEHSLIISTHDLINFKEYWSIVNATLLR